MKITKKHLHIVGALVVLFMFQNCGRSFSPQHELTSLSGGPVTPQPVPQPEPQPQPNPFPDPGATAQNSLDTTDPNVVIPTIAALVPDGIMTTDEFPMTIDLAEISRLYLDGITNTLLPEDQYFLVPPGMVNMHGTPTAIFTGGAPNWGKSIQAMVQARRISGYDLNDANGTLTKQLKSTRNMIDPNVNRNLINRGEGAWHVVTGANPENQMTTTVEALMELYKQYPSHDLRRLIQNMITYHSMKAVDGFNDNGEPMRHYRLPEPGVSPYVPNSIGTIGYGDSPFIVGKSMRALAAWFLQVFDVQAMTTTMLLSHYVRNYSGGLFWRTPQGFLEGAGEAHYAGHIHMYLNALMGILWEAEGRLKLDPNDAFAWQLIEFVKRGYIFTRNLHAESAYALGNFGEICATADMLKIAVKLTELGAGDYNEDIDRWMRNQIVESQIRGAITIESNVDPLKDRIGAKVIGLFYEDSTHALAIPDRTNGQGSLTLQLVACGLGNVMHAIYDVWEHIVQFKDNRAQVNLLMNKATWYLDVKSEVPYRGAVHIVTRADLGPINALEVRIPEGVPSANVLVFKNGASIPYIWRGNFVQLSGIQPSTTYTITFPQVYKQMPFTQVRNQTQNWAESSYSIDPGNGQDYGFHENLAENRYVGTFRGNTMVTADHWPSFGIPLYRGEARRYWESLGAADAPATPMIVSQRFRLKPK